MKRFGSIFLSVCLMLTMALGNPVFAAGAVVSEVNSASDGSLQMVRVNPLYGDVISVEDLDKPVAGEEHVGASSTVYSTVADAAKAVCSSMKKRQGTVNLSISSSTDFQALSDQIIEAATEHTGVPTEGDYLKWQYAGYYSSGSYSQSGSKKTYAITFTITYYTTAAQENQVTAKVDSVLSQLNVGSASTSTKIKKVYDYVAANVRYDYANLNNNSYKLQYTAYGALINGTSVCQGYAVLMYRFLEELKVNCRVITGLGNGGAHAWNIAGIDGKYYNMDVTWDEGQSTYSYYLRSTANFPDHTRDTEYNTSAFNSKYPMSATNFSGDSGDSTSGGNDNQDDDSNVNPPSDEDGDSDDDSDIEDDPDEDDSDLDEDEDLDDGEDESIELAQPVITSLLNTTKGQTLKFNAVENATHYEIDCNGAELDVCEAVEGEVLSYANTKATTNGTTYKYQVYALYDDGESDEYVASEPSETKSLCKLSNMTISSLTNTASKKMNLKWKANTKASGYQIQYSTSSKFTSPKYVKVSGAKTVKKTITSLKKGKTYYVRIRSYKGSAYSAWSTAKKIKISR